MDAVSVETMASAWGRPSGEVLVLCGTWVLAANVVLVAALMFTRSMTKMMSPWSCSSGQQAALQDSPAPRKVITVDIAGKDPPADNLTLKVEEPSSLEQEDEVQKAAQALLNSQLFEKVAYLPQSNVITSNPLQTASGANMEQTSPRRPMFEGEIVQLSASPELYLLKGFLSGEEADHLIKVARSTMTRSRVVDHTTGAGTYSSSRTSTGTFLLRKEDATVAAIEQRVSQMSGIPAERAVGGLQVLRYEKGQAFDAHYDYYDKEFLEDHPLTRQRMATAIMYLSTPEKGGETAFPRAKGMKSDGNKVKSTRGNALLFYSLTEDGRRDVSSYHQSCTVLAGTKWCCTQWFSP